MGLSGDSQYHSKDLHVRTGTSMALHLRTLNELYKREPHCSFTEHLWEILVHMKQCK